MKQFQIPAVAAVLLLGAGIANAQIVNEIGDAGETLATAQVLPAGTTTVLGFIAANGDVDMYAATFDFTGDLVVTVDDFDDDFDPNLHAFNSAGNPIGADDDSSPNTGLGSQLTLSITPGTYYFAIGDNNLEANDINGVRIQDNDSGVLNPNGVFDHWDRDESGDAGNYTMTFSVATVAPAAPGIPVLGGAFLPLTLGGLAALGILVARRRRNRAA